MKLQNPTDILLSYNVVLINSIGEYKDLPIRYLETRGVVQVGEPKSSFDRWANSVDFEFDVFTPKGQRQFIRWLDSLCSL